jgi:hypothetical protein
MTTPKGEAMPKERQIRVYGVPRDDIDIDLMAQIVIQMGRQLAQETITDEPLPPTLSPHGLYEETDDDTGVAP